MPAGCIQDGCGRDSRKDETRPHCVFFGSNPEMALSFSAGDEVPAVALSTAGLDAFFCVKPVDDSLFAAMQGNSYRDGCPVSRDELRYLRLLHRDNNGRSLVGEIVSNAAIADELLLIFKTLYVNGYPIERIRLVDVYGGDDNASMLDNNSSCFNFRQRSHQNSALSLHASGLAVDINPLYNPFYRKLSDGSALIEPSVSAKYLDRNAEFPYKITREDICRRLFVEHGYYWGGGWANSIDYQHFEKRQY